MTQAVPSSVRQLGPEAVDFYFYLIEEKGQSLSMAEIMATRKPPGGHEPYWGLGFTSDSLGVPAKQAKEHHEWCQNRGLVGTTVEKDGSTTWNSPGDKDKYVKERGLCDHSPAGGRFIKKSKRQIRPSRDEE